MSSSSWDVLVVELLAELARRVESAKRQLAAEGLAAERWRSLDAFVSRAERFLRWCRRVQ